MTGKFSYKIPLALGALFVLIVVGAIVYSHYAWQKGLSDFEASLVSKTPIDQVQTSNLQLDATTTGGCPPTVCYELSAEIKNDSAYPFNWITGALNAYDCPTETINADCTQIGQDTDVILTMDSEVVGDDFPPNQVREASGWVELDGMPPVKGYFLWTYTITQLQEMPSNASSS